MSFHDKAWPTSLDLMNAKSWCKSSKATHPQCFMFWGLSILTAILMRRSSGKFLVLCIWCHSGVRPLFAVGLMTTFKEDKEDENKIDPFHINNLLFVLFTWNRHDGTSNRKIMTIFLMKAFVAYMQQLKWKFCAWYAVNFYIYHHK